METVGLKVTLTVGQSGDIMLDWDNGTFLKVVGQQVNPGPDGKPDPPPLPGYPANGTFYKQGSNLDEIIAGDSPVTMDLVTAAATTDHVSRSRILKVLEDGSFFVAVEAVPMQWTPPYNTASLYVLHYTSAGRLIDRARVSTAGQFYTNAHLIAPGPDGAFYAVGLWANVPSAPPAEVDVVRLNFYPASQPLPPVPTPISTPILPTAIPTIEQRIPTPLPTNSK
jgi:hypothetical protein